MRLLKAGVGEIKSTNGQDHKSWDERGSCKVHKRNDTMVEAIMIQSRNGKGVTR